MMSLKYLLQFPISWYENNRLRTLSSTVHASSTSTSPHAVQSGNRALVRLCFFFLLVAMSMATRIFLPMYHAPNSLYCIRIEGTHLKTSSSSSVTLFLTRSHPCTHMHRLSFPILLLPPPSFLLLLLPFCGPVHMPPIFCAFSIQSLAKGKPSSAVVGSPACSGYCGIYLARSGSCQTRFEHNCIDLTWRAPSDGLWCWKWCTRCWSRFPLC